VDASLEPSDHLSGQGRGGSKLSYQQALASVASETSPYPARSMGGASTIPLANTPSVESAVRISPDVVVATAEARLGRPSSLGSHAPPKASQKTAAENVRDIAEATVGQLAIHDVDTFLVDTPWAAPYKLPRNPADLYHKQIHSTTRVPPSSIVYNANKWQDNQPLLSMPFDRSMRKIPAPIRPTSAGPACGPLHHPNEPIWFEMMHRLQGILKKQGKRAERRRRRRLKSRLFKGRSRHEPQKRDEGKQLREYLDRAAADAYAATAEKPGEFLSKVHERYLLNQDKLEQRPFRMRAARGIGESVERKRHVVRPVYVPPPPSSLSGH
jgi:hypothetical protein